MRTSSSEILIEIDRSRPRGLRVQVEEELKHAIREGRLAPGTLLPSSRALASDLGVTRGVVVAAYDQLLAEGYLSSRPGAATVVNPTAPTSAGGSARPADLAPPVVVDFRPGLPDLSLFPRGAWARATRAALQTLPDADLGYTDPAGLPQLREAVADYLRRVRGVTADPRRVVVCNGFSHGLSLVVRVLTDLGHDAFAVEDPGYEDPRDEIRWLGARCHAVPVDDDGIVVDALRRTPARVALVTPAHQCPTGSVLSPARRLALVEWARDVDGYVIEDDYDAEYRYDRQPVGALQGLAPDRVIYSATLSKSLAPGMRLGWLVLPESLAEPIVAARHITDHASASLMQAACATFLTTGDLDRHLRRTRRVYRDRRDKLIAALGRWLPDATTSGIAAGLQVLVTLPRGLDDVVVAERALAAGVRVNPLRQYRASPRSSHPPALVLGYGAIPPAASELGVRLLAEAIANL